MSLVCWVASRGIFPPACWENQPFPMAGMIVALCLYAATVAVTTRGYSRGAKLLAAVWCLTLPCVSVLLAAGSAEILVLEGSHLWRHLFTLIFVWVELAQWMTVLSYAAWRQMVLKNEEKTQ